MVVRPAKKASHLQTVELDRIPFTDFKMYYKNLAKKNMHNSLLAQKTRNIKASSISIIITTNQPNRGIIINHCLKKSPPL